MERVGIISMLLNLELLKHLMILEQHMNIICFHKLTVAHIGI